MHLKRVLISAASAAALTATLVPAGHTAGPELAQTVHVSTETRSSITQPKPILGSHVNNNRTHKRYSYANAIRESVQIKSGFDSDNDGVEDLITLDLVRPKELAFQGLQVPVIILPSPYFHTTKRGPNKEKKLYNEDGSLKVLPLWYDNYFVERGYAVAALDLTGTGRSTGCGDVGGKFDIGSVTAAVDWLNGRKEAHYLAGGTGAAKASWSTGSVGLIGGSYDGTVANGAAATGVDGLKTIVPIAAISSWYFYNRYDGVPYKKDYMGWLGQYVSNDPERCKAIHDQVTAVTEDGLGMNPGWHERDHLKDAHKVKSSVLVAHGTNDFNVKMVHAGRWYQELKKQGVPTRVWLSQGAHSDPFNGDRNAWVEYLHTWFDYWLGGLPNNVMENRAATTEHPVGTYNTDATWPVGQTQRFPLAEKALGKKSDAILRLDNKRHPVSDEDLPKSHYFMSAPLTKDVRMSGASTLTLRVKTPGGVFPLNAAVAEHGKIMDFKRNKKQNDSVCIGGSTPDDSGCYATYLPELKEKKVKAFTRGWLNSDFRHGIHSPKPMPADQWEDVTVKLQTSERVLQKGHRIAVWLWLTSPTKRVEFKADNPIEIDLSGSYFEGRFVNGDAIAAVPDEDEVATQPELVTEVSPFVEESTDLWLDAG